MKRSGFTMIELVFIIVILGILGAIAVPKMAASRLDAKIVAIKSDIGTFAQAIPAMAMSQNNAATITFANAVSVNEGNWGKSSDDKKIWSKIKKDGSSATAEGDACVVITIDSTAKTMTITHKLKDNAGIACNRIAGREDNATALAEDMKQIIELTGKGVTF